MAECLRAATPADAAALAAIDAVCNPSPWSADAFAETLARAPALVALDAGGAIAGFVVISVVADECEILGSRFRFLHVERCAGFKAGALNIALRHTDPAASVIAVIDSDYVVRADWLANLTPHFADPKVAIVDANTRETFGGGHLPGARWYREGPSLAAVLPADKATRLVFYCSGPS